MTSSRSQQVVLTDNVLDYLLAHSAPLPAGIDDAMARAEAMGMPSMQISPDQAILMRMLVRLSAARRALEIGTFLGLSALVLADAVGPGGEVVCLDRSEEWTSHARTLWEEAGVGERIDLRIGDAHELVRSLSRDIPSADAGNIPPERGETSRDASFDVVFIDADKGGYVDYLEQVTPLLRTGGLLLVDNTLWSGRVSDPDDDNNGTAELRAFNATLAADPRYHVAIVAVGDGLTVAQRL